MYQDYGFCPRCTQSIDKERRLDEIVVCGACGFVLSNAEKKSAKSSQASFFKIGVALCVLFISVFVQICVWDGYAFEVIPLEIKELAGMSQMSDVERMAAICLERKRYKCVETEYLRLAKKDPKQLLRLGKLQMTRLQYKDAASTYHRYFSSGGQDLEGRFAYAQALSQIGEVDEARKYYRSIMLSQADAITQAAAAHSYEKLKEAKPVTASRGLASVPVVR